MDTSEGAFIEWAEAPSRTLEEKFGIVLLIETFAYSFRRSQGNNELDFRKEAKIREARAYNPVYEPHLHPGLLRFAAGKLATLEHLSLGGNPEDRPLRDLSFLAFLPALPSLSIGGLDREDLEGIQHLRALRTLTIRTDSVEDYSALGACPVLKELTVYTFAPWPVLTGLDGHPTLEKFKWHGKKASLGSISSLPALRHLHACDSYGSLRPEASFRDPIALPDMPLLEHLSSGWFYRLDGIARFPRLRFLTVLTLSKTLAPLAALRQLTHLRVSAPLLEEIATVAAMPSVLDFALYSPRPQDWGGLVESDSLREVTHWTNLTSETDLESLRLFLPPWDEFFTAPEPRQPGSMRLLIHGCDDVEGKPGTLRSPPVFPEGEDGWFGNQGMVEAESNWVNETLRDALRRAGYFNLQGVRFSIERETGASSCFSSLTSPPKVRTAYIDILGALAIAEMPGICDCLRRALATFRYRWEINVTVNPEPDADEWDETWRNVPALSREEQEAEEKRYRDYHAERKRILLEDQLRARMLRELGEDLSGFKTSPLPSRPIPGEFAYLEAPEEEDPEETEDPRSGGIADYDAEKAENDEHWLPAPPVTDPNKTWNANYCQFPFDEDGIHIHAKHKALENLCDLFDLTPEKEG